ncbi:acetyltransferase [Seiridium cupressi]
MVAQSLSNQDLRIEVITDASDFVQAYECILNAFGHQINDGIWTTMSPGWNTPEGKAKNTEDLRRRWEATKDAGNTIFVKASLPDLESQGARRIVGVAIWVHASAVPGEGEAPAETDVAAVYPDDEREQRYLSQLLASLHKNRLELIKEKAKPESKQKSVMVLDLCVTDPAFQRRGVAKNLVKWGLDEAKRRGDIEASTEASIMGRHVYKQLGFHGVEEIIFEVDEEFQERSMPSNLFMRTRPNE